MIECTITGLAVPECSCRACTMDKLASRINVARIDAGEYVSRVTVDVEHRDEPRDVPITIHPPR